VTGILDSPHRWLRTPVRSGAASHVLGLVSSVALAASLACPRSASADGTTPGRTTEPRLRLTAEQRTRGEAQSHRFRRDESGPTHTLALRTRLQLDLQAARPLRLSAEIQDSRGVLNDAPFESEARHVDEVDITQLFARLGWNESTSGRMPIVAQAGRFSLDVGSRRLAARNRMRNTTNAFDGVLLSLTRPGRWRGRLFATRPVTLKPRSPDSSTPERVFLGADLVVQRLRWAQLDAAIVRLRESDDTPQRRRLTTVALRTFKRPGSGEIDYEAEADWQRGTSKGLDHTASNYHAELGWTFSSPWKPRVSAHFDDASGDRDPTDARAETFDPLYGSRRFDFGPTGIYGPFTRSNLVTPGIRGVAAPAPQLEVMVFYRALWLDQARDAWAGSGLADPTGRSGRFLGHHLESRVAWKASSGLEIEGGWAHFFKGSYLDRVPGGPPSSDSDYVYAELTVRADVLGRRH
jgi:hypothetical protein